MVSRRFALAALALAGVTIAVHARSQAPGRSTAPPAGIERHLVNIRQLTSGGENAEAYFSPEGRHIAGCLRPDVHDERRRIEQASRQQRRTHDLRLFLSRRPVDSLRVDASGVGCVPAASELRARLRVARLRVVRHFPREVRRIQPSTSHDYARLRCRSHHRPGWPHRVYECARRRHGNLFDEW